MTKEAFNKEILQAATPLVEGEMFDHIDNERRNLLAGFSLLPGRPDLLTVFSFSMYLHNYGGTELFKHVNKVVPGLVERAQSWQLTQMRLLGDVHTLRNHTKLRAFGVLRDSLSALR
jgi:hypothetical protein